MISLRNFRGKYIIYFILFNVCELWARAASTDLSGDTTKEVNDPDLYTPFDAGDTFSWVLIKRLLQQEKTNVIISPFSVRIIIALLAEAAGSHTQTQVELIHAILDAGVHKNMRGVYRELLASLKAKSPDAVLNLETRIFTDKFIQPKEQYAATISHYYDTDIERLDFKYAKRSAKRINSWCKNVTHGRLQDIVTADDITNSVIVMANVIYFNGLWHHEFDDTFSGLFYSTPTTKHTVQYMRQENEFYYYRNMSTYVEMLRLPYRGKNLSMFILLQGRIGGIDGLIEILQNGEVKRMQSEMMDGPVRVNLPKFKFEYEKDLTNVLKSMGLNSIFSDNSYLPGLNSGSGPLQVSKVAQKAAINVNEKGSEAYGATTAHISNRMGPVLFIANRPFVFFIEEEITGTIIFAGKVLEPVL